MKNQKKCYICDTNLSNGERLDSDHIVPNGVFSKSDADRPQLLVHQDCNNKKSKDDRWFVKKVLLLCSTNKEAEAELMEFLQKAQSQERYAYLEDQPKSKTKDLKLMHTIFDEYIGSQEVTLDGVDLIQLSRQEGLGEDTRLISYVKQMCRGLFILNVPNSTPQLPRIKWYVYDALKLNNKLDEVISNFKRLFKTSESSNFTQYWGNRIFYLGSRVAESSDKGYIYIEFFEKVGIFAVFDLV